jgi:hypothetical protein
MGGFISLPFMPIPSCRGLPARRWIVDNYELLPLAHVALLPGQKKLNEAGGVLTDRYYAFEYKELANQSNYGVFYCGYVCGESFCDLLGVAHLPQFDPLIAVSTPGATSVSAMPIGGTPRPAGGAIGTTGHAPVMDALNLEMYQAINLHVVLSNTPPLGGYAATLAYIRNNPARRTRPDYVLRFNNYLMKRYGGATLLSKCLAIPGMKPFAFPEIGAVLTAAGAPVNYYA